MAKFVTSNITKFYLDGREWTDSLMSLTVFRTAEGVWKIVGDGCLDVSRLNEILTCIPVGFATFKINYSGAASVEGTADVENIKILAEVGNAVTFKLTLSSVNFWDDTKFTKEIIETTSLGKDAKTYQVVEKVND